MSLFVDTPQVRIWIEDGILFGTYKAIDLDLDQAREALEARIKFTGGKSYPLLADMRELKSFSKEARKYMAAEGARGITAGALVTGNSFTRLVAELFLLIDKPPVPTKMFGDAEEEKYGCSNTAMD